VISAFLAATDITPTEDPTSYKQAMSSAEAELWLQAMKEEIKCLIENGTWELTDLPEGRHTVKCKWVYLTKRDTQGNVTRHRAHLVTKGFLQTAVIDYEETFAPAWINM
jgi:Reverse transcriptase (RNA-dependent DNA polymerase)